MKKLILTTLYLLLFVQIGKSQTLMPKNISDDFANSIIKNYFSSSSNTHLFLCESLRKKGYYNPEDINILVKSITINEKNRNIILAIFHDNFGKDKEYLYYNLLSLGISSTSSKYLTEYILAEKYKPVNHLASNDASLSSKTFKGAGSSSSGSGGFSLGNRKLISKPTPKYTCNESGTVVVEVIVDRNGNTIEAKAGIKGSTTTATCLLEQAKIAAMNTQWDANSNAPEKQVGKIFYNFNLN